MGGPLRLESVGHFAWNRWATSVGIRTHRLHRGIGYVTPAAMHFGKAEWIQQERRAKLAQAQQRRMEENLNARQRSRAPAAHSGASSPPSTLTPPQSV
jgi:hypothetical protein